MKKAIYILLGFAITVSICSCKAKKNETSDSEVEAVETVAEEETTSVEQTEEASKNYEYFTKRMLPKSEDDSFENPVYKDTDLRSIANSDRIYCVANTNRDYSCRIACYVPEGEYNHSNLFYEVNGAFEEGDYMKFYDENLFYKINEFVSEYMFIVEVYQGDDMIGWFRDDCHFGDGYNELYFSVIVPQFSEHDLVIFHCGLAAYEALGYVENNEFRLIDEYYSDEIDYSKEYHSNYDLVFAGNEIRNYYYTFDPADGPNVKVHGKKYTLRTKTSGTSKQLYFDAEKVENEIVIE